MSEREASAADVDPAELQSQLDEIKGAMGIEQRYPGQGRFWLVYGGLVGGFTIVLQFLFALPVPQWVYYAAWTAFAVLGVGSLWALARRTPGRSAEPATPGWIPMIGGLVALVVVVSTMVQPLLEAADVAGVVQGAFFFGLAIAAGGLGFLLVGNALRAHRIRRRDRLVFYAGGVWMLVFAAAFPLVEWLRYFGYGTFGVLTLGQSIASYLLLTRD